MSSESLHEPGDQLSGETLERHRAIVSLMEELEAIDWYHQRIDATADPSLAAILTKNRDEEKEHASMLLEWLRRRDRQLDDNLRTFLFTSEPITVLEARSEAAGEAGGPVGGPPSGPADAVPASGAGDGSLGIGSLRGLDG